MGLRSRYTEWLQWVMVLIVLLATVYVSLIERKTDFLFNLCTLTFGYYFGSNQSNTPPDLPA